MTVYVSGTFNHLHDGHIALLQRAVDMAGKKDNLWIGIMSDEHLRAKYPRADVTNLQLYINRERAIKDWLNSADPPVWRKGRVAFEYVHDPLLFPEKSSEEDILVVSEESAERGAKLIAEHNSRMLMSVVPIVRNKEGYKISSRDMLPVEETYRTFEDMVRDLGECVIHDPTYGYYQYHYKGKKYTWNDLCPEYNPKSEEDGEPI